MVIIRPPLPFIIWQKLSDKFKRDTTPQSAVIKDLENVCVDTHRDLLSVAEAFKALDNFPLNEYCSFALDAPSIPPLYGQINRYYSYKEAGEAKYELHKVREISLLSSSYALEQIEKLKDYLKQSQSMLKDKTTWLWKLIKSQNFAPISSYEATKLADFKAFSNDEQEAIKKLADETMQIFYVITAKCVDNGRWRSVDDIIQNSQSGLKPYVIA